MNISLFSFKQFLMEEMDPTPEKNRDGASDQPAKRDYFKAVGEEFGLEWPDLVKAFENERWISSGFSLGDKDKEIMYKQSPWQIVKGSLTPNGADIQLKPHRRSVAFLSNGSVMKGKYQDTKRYHLNRKQLIDFLTKGWEPAVQSAGGPGGGMGGL
jgi:hypothetical protein